jgi:argininosuccinate synthase
MNYCDCCNEPMVWAANYRADSCSAGCDTSACILCAGDGPRKLEILAEIVDLGQHWNEDKVAERILQLGDQIAKVRS